MLYIFLLFTRVTVVILGKIEGKSFTRIFIMNFRLLLCTCFLSGSFIVCEGKYGYVTWTADVYHVNTTDYFAEIPDVHVARATYSNDINETGYVFL